MKHPKVAIIILNWNGRDDTLACLESVFRIDYPNYGVIVVDNGSSDDSVPAIHQRFPQARVIETGENLGYAGGNNVGIKYALENNFDAILLLNNDTIVDKNVLNAFFSALSRYPEGAILGAKIYYHSQPHTLWFAGGKWVRETMDFIHIGQNQEDDRKFSRDIVCDYITGCALFASAQVFRRVGLLDEDFFLTYEETDWCYRAKELGYPSICIPEAKVWHKVSASFGGEYSPLSRYFLTRNRLLWGKKHLPPLSRFYLQLKVLKKMLPMFSPTDEGIAIYRKLLWGTATWIRQFKRNIHDSAWIAETIGIRDYYLRRYGNCPPVIRKLNQS